MRELAAANVLIITNYANVFAKHEYEAILDLSIFLSIRLTSTTTANQRNPQRRASQTKTHRVATPAEVRFEYLGRSVMCNLKRPMGKLGDIGGKSLLPGKKSIRNFGENFGAFVSNFTSFFGYFIQQKGDVEKHRCVVLLQFAHLALFVALSGR